MEATGTQRFNKHFMQVVLAWGAGILLFSLLRLPFAQLGIAFLLFTLATIHLGSRYALSIPRFNQTVTPTDALILLSMLLFDGEAAVLLTLVAVPCIALRTSKNVISLLFHTAIAVIGTFLIVWTLRLNFGSIVELGRGGYSFASVNAICTAILLKAAIDSTIVAIGGAYKINQKILLTWGGSYLWTALSYAAAAIVVSLVAQLANRVGVNALIAVSTAAAILLFAYRSYLKNAALSVVKNNQAEQRQTASVRENSDRFRSAFDHAAIGMALVSSEGRWLQVNRSLCDILGYSERELLTTDFLAITHPDDLSSALSNIKQLLKGQIPTYQMEKRYIHKQGHEVWVHWSVSLARDTHTTSSVHLIFQIQDITDRKLAEQQLHHDAFHDALTGLPNRALFIDHLKLAINRSLRNPEQMFAVLYLDLDRFKIINDSLGHMIGDQLLVGIARRLEKCLRPGDTVARLGGDEFTVLIEDVKYESEAIYIAERIQKELVAPFNLSGREVFTTVSMGIAPSSTGYERAEDMLRDADTAMYRAKSSGKARHEIFDKAMHARALNLLQLETDLRRAIEREEFFIQYQPIVSLEDFNLRGFEALVRWRHPERGFISPIDFVPVAEETGLIVQLGEWVLRESCLQMKRWQTLFPSDPPLFISVNLSTKQFTQPDLINEIAYILNETKLDAHSLKLEITESAVMENIETATGMLKQLRALGVQLSIDDFGTGYSSLSYLHRFPIDTLKIDRSFITQMSDNNENVEIVRTIVVLAQNLGMDVVAEGVETNEQLAILRKLGCQNGQGYFFSKPVHTDGAERIISETYAYPVPASYIEPIPSVHPAVLA
ncbi:MAG TPA: EAL domain-containing protein [Pyrinomonadaceae bacterium]|jgi:diguanylate cyclase (GGDEF)-like protein/PAS domain S-box-containing protein